MRVAGILGIGVDIVDTARVKHCLATWGARFANKVFTRSEQDYCAGKVEAWRHYAGRFAVKEAVSKAFGTGIGQHIGWLDIEVMRDKKTGAPSALLSARAQALADARGVTHIWISLSHTGEYTVAQAVLEHKGNNPL